MPLGHGGSKPWPGGSARYAKGGPFRAGVQRRSSRIAEGNEVYVVASRKTNHRQGDTRCPVSVVGRGDDDVKSFSQEKPQSDLAASGAPATGVPAGYALQAEDEIAVHSVQVKEISDKAYYLDRNGEVNFPLAGVLQLSGGPRPRG